jgi:hypothetical protein
VLGTAVRGAGSALDAPPVKESPATEDQQHDEDDEERVRVHGVSCLKSVVAAGLSVGSDVRIPDGLLIAYNRVAQAKKDVCSFLNTSQLTNPQRRARPPSILAKIGRAQRGQGQVRRNAGDD